MRALNHSTLRLCTGLAVLFAPTLLGARGCDPTSHEVCTDEHAPVCGIDGTTYGNACEADRAGVEIAHEGECGVACYEVYAPVCGDDGTTYPNDCYARAAGAGIAHDGACECAVIECAFHECEFGFARSADGCPSCECNPPPVCEPVLCDLYCEGGFAVDPTTGCETCSCGEPPTSCESDADCAAEEMCLLPPCLPVCMDEDGDGACDDTCSPGVCAPREMERSCASDAECGEGGFCEIVGCTSDCGSGSEYDCGAPSACFGYCRALPPPPPPSECTSDADCAEGGFCDTSECLPVGDLTVCGGYCRPIEPEPTHCDSDADCGAGAHCELLACAAVCEVPEGGAPDDCLWDCAGGFCVADEPPPPPADACTSDADCLDGQLCVLPDVLCACVAEPCDCPAVEGFCAWREDDPSVPPAPGPAGV